MIAKVKQILINMYKVYSIMYEKSSGVPNFELHSLVDHSMIDFDSQ